MKIIRQRVVDVYAASATITSSWWLGALAS